jgi:hypothetical protein
VPHALIDSVLILVVAGSCAVEYGGARALGRLPASKQNWIFLALGAECVPMAMLIRGSLWATDCLVLAAALCAGVLVSRLVRSAGALVAFLVAGATADIVSTYAGPTHWLVAQVEHSGGSAAIQFLAMCIRVRGQLIPVIGVSDLLFFAFCVTVMRRLGWPEAPVLLVPLAAYLLALGAGLAIRFTPAIPWLAVAVILYAYATHRTQPRESL